MSDVEFNPDSSGGLNFKGGARRGAVAGGWLVRLTMKLTGIQDEAKVNQALLLLTIICFAAAGLVLWSSF